MTLFEYEDDPSTNKKVSDFHLLAPFLILLQKLRKQICEVEHMEI